MTSAAKIAANRCNARKSTGPRSQAGKMRSRRNAFRHGLSIPISADIALAGQIEPLTNELAEGASQPGQREAARMAALAQLELARAQQVKVQMINRAAQDLQKENCCEPEELAVLAYARQLKALVRFNRYERRALSQRNRALRDLGALIRVAHPRTRAVRWRNLFVQPAWAFNVHALVKAALESMSHTLGGAWDCPQIKGLRVTVHLQGDQSGFIQFAFAQDPMQEFAIAKTLGRHGGRLWGAICPKTTKKVEDLFLKESKQRIGSRYALGLSYRSKHSKRVPHGRPESTNIDTLSASIELAITPTPPRAIEREDCSGEPWLMKDDEFSQAQTTSRQRSDSCAVQNGHSGDRQPDPAIPNDYENASASTHHYRSDHQSSGASSMPVDPTASLNLDHDVDAGPPPSKPVDASSALDLKAGGALCAEGKLDEALAVYRAICEVELANPNSVQAAKQADKARHRIGDLAFDYLLKGRFEQALACVDEALAAHPKSMILIMTRAHALMFLEHRDEAQEIYRHYHGKNMMRGWTCDGYIQNAFDELREAGHSHPLMTDIEQRMLEPYETDQQSADAIEPAVQVIEPATQQHQSQVAVARPVDIELGDRLRAEGKLDEAYVSYRRCLSICNERITEDVTDSRAQNDFSLAVDRIGGLAFDFLLKRRAERALQVIEEAMSYRDWVRLRLICAHALMLSPRKTDALNMHRENYSRTLESGEAWGDAIRADFDMLRTAGVKNLPIMDEIERQFASKY